jgi:hypothetical protein
MKLAKVGWVGSSSVVERGIKVIAPGHQFNNLARHEKAEDHTCHQLARGHRSLDPVIPIIISYAARERQMQS